MSSLALPRIKAHRKWSMRPRNQQYYKDVWAVQRTEKRASLRHQHWCPLTAATVCQGRTYTEWRKHAPVLCVLEEVCAAHWSVVKISPCSQLWWWQNTYGGCFACLASNDCESVRGLERGYPLWTPVITEISVCLRDCLLCQWANCRPLHV